jgi:hypothetical protein
MVIGQCSQGFPSMNLKILIAHSPSPLDSPTKGQPYQRLPYLEVEDNGLTRFIPLGACFPN